MISFCLAAGPTPDPGVHLNRRSSWIVTSRCCWVIQIRCGFVNARTRAEALLKAGERWPHASRLDVFINNDR